MSAKTKTTKSTGKRKLTTKQTKFKNGIIENMTSKVTKSNTQIAIDAGYSPKTAYSIASENLSKPDIKAEIDEIQARISGKLEITLEEISNNARYLIELGKNKKNGADIAAGNKQLGEMRGAFKQVVIETEVKPEVVMFKEVMDKGKE